MNLSQICETLHASVLTGQTVDELAREDIRTACGSDLMSDVLAFVKERGILLTGLVNPQVVRTAEMMDIYAVCFVRGKRPDDSIVALAREHGLVLLSTEYPMYIACGKLYRAGLTCGEG